MIRVWVRLENDEGSVIIDDFTDKGELITGTIPRKSTIEFVAHVLECTLERNNNVYELY